MSIFPVAHQTSATHLLLSAYSLSPDPYGAPATPTYNLYAPAPEIPNPYDLGYDFFTGAGSSSLPAAHYPPTSEPPYEECELTPLVSDLTRALTIRDTVGHQFPQPGPLAYDMPPFGPTMVSGSTLLLAWCAYTCPQDAAPPKFPLPAPVASLSGPKRTKQPTREGRRYDPTKTTKKVGTKKGGWDQTLTRFRARLHDDLYGVRDGQPSGGLVPAMALAKFEKIVKEDLKRSVSGFFYCVLVHHFTNSSTWQQPLRDTAAGKGTRSRNVEDYLKGLLGALRRAGSPPKLDASGSDEDDTSLNALSRRECFFSSFRSDPSN